MENFPGGDGIVAEGYTRHFGFFKRGCSAQQSIALAQDRIAKDAARLL
jgi:hypothetical protein